MVSSPLGRTFHLEKDNKKVFSISRQGLPADNAAVCLLGKIPTAAAVGQFPFLIRPSIMLAFTNSCHCCLLPMWHHGTKDGECISEEFAEYTPFFPKIWPVSLCISHVVERERAVSNSLDSSSADVVAHCKNHLICFLTFWQHVS